MRAVRLLLTLLLLQVALVQANHDAPPPLAEQVKAAFIFKFCSYVEWPAEIFAGPQSPIVIATLERDASMAHLLEETVRDRRVGTRPVEIRILPDGAEVSTNVHVFYLDGSARSVRRQIAALQGQPILIVTDLAKGLDLGSSINFSREEGRVRFDISLTTARDNRLKVSSRLLTVARRIEGAAP